MVVVMMMVMLSFNFLSVFECSECLKFTLFETLTQELTDILLGITDFHELLLLLLWILLSSGEELLQYSKEGAFDVFIIFGLIGVYFPELTPPEHVFFWLCI